MARVFYRIADKNDMPRDRSIKAFRGVAPHTQEIDLCETQVGDLLVFVSLGDSDMPGWTLVGDVPEIE